MAQFLDHLDCNRSIEAFPIPQKMTFAKHHDPQQPIYICYNEKNLSEKGW